MSFQLLITKTEHNWIEVGYGSYRRGSVKAMSTTTASFDTKQEADTAADILRKEGSASVQKLYEETK